MFCNSGVRWFVYSYCVLQFRVALVCVFLLCFAIQGCAGLRILNAFCNGQKQTRTLDTHTHIQTQKPQNTYTYKHTVRVYKIYCEVDLASRHAAKVASLWLRSFLFESSGTE